MTGALLGLAAGLGILLIVIAVVSPRSAPEPHVSRLRRLVDRAGLARVSPSAVLAASAGLALVSGLVVLAISGVVVVGLLAAIVAGYLPVAILRRRARSPSSARS